MAKSLWIAGLAGSIVLASGWVARAQDAQQPCSLLGCVFSGTQSQAPQPQAQALPADAAQTAQGAQAPQDTGAPQAAQVPQAGGAPQDVQAQQAQAQQAQAQQDQAQQDYESPKATDGSAMPKPKPKPAHLVTIAAEASEIGRMKGLVAAMPKGKVKIVKAVSSDSNADFSVSTVLDPHESGEKAKLFTEQMHIVAGAQVLSVADLKDKVVSFGPDKSPSQVAARAAFEALNIPVKETPLDLDNALDGLATGDVAAVVVLAPQPFARFETLSGPGLHLVSWPQDGALPTGAVASTIDSAQYPGLAKPDAPIRAVGVDAVLKISARGEHQSACKIFLSTLAQRSATLSKHGFDLLKADLESRTGRAFASAEPR